MLAVLTSPWLLRAAAVRMLFPSKRGNETLKCPELDGAEIPLTVTAAAGSLTVPVTVTGLEFIKLRLVGEVIAIVAGGVPTTFNVSGLENARTRLPLKQRIPAK